MKNIIYLMFVIIVLTSCEKEKKNLALEKSPVSKKEIKDTIVIDELYNKKFDKHLQKLSLPIGNLLVLTEFPDKWDLREEDVEEKKGKYEIICDSLSFDLSSYMYENSLKFDENSLTHLQNPISMCFNYYEDYTNYAYAHKIKKTETIPISEIKNFKDNINLVFTLNVNARYLNALTVNSKGSIIDCINIGYTQNVFEFSYSGKYYFIDKNKIIHLKSFISLEIEEIRQRYEKYQILSNGKIVRYFDKDSGKYKDKEEEGNIKNHTKDGVWVETKSNMYIEEHTYVEAQYKLGKPIGIWKYYNIVNDTKKGNKLLMTEEYDTNGNLLKREILKN